jgi:hypothetical protein
VPERAQWTVSAKTDDAVRTHVIRIVNAKLERKGGTIAGSCDTRPNPVRTPVPNPAIGARASARRKCMLLSWRVY